jgi:hypothetical protein
MEHVQEGAFIASLSFNQTWHLQLSAMAVRQQCPAARPAGSSRQAVSTKDEQAGHRTWASRGTDQTLQQRADGRRTDQVGPGAGDRCGGPQSPWPKARMVRHVAYYILTYILDGKLAASHAHDGAR